MKKYSICISNIMEKKGREEFVINKENVKLLRLNKYNAYVMLDDIKNALELVRIPLELSGVVLIKNKYYYDNHYDKFVDSQNNNVEIKNTDFLGVCKYLRREKQPKNTIN